MADLCGDNRFDLIEKYKQKLIEETNIESAPDEMKVLDNILFRFWQMGWLDKLEQPSAQQWIPVKFRLMDSEEREYWEEQFGGQLADEDAVIFDCPMPEDGQEILVSYRKWISMDKCEIDGGCYGLEGNGDWDGVVAWMPLPEPWKGEQE